jgi:hypothetical protein
MLISWAVSKEHRRFIWSSSASPCHYLPGLDPSKTDMRSTARCTKKPSSSYLRCPLGTPSPATVPEQDMIVLVVPGRAAYEVRRCRVVRDFLAPSICPSVCWVRHDSRSRVMICSFVCDFSRFAQRYSPSRRDLLISSTPVLAYRDEADRGRSWDKRGRVTFVRGRGSNSIHSLLLLMLQRSNTSLPRLTNIGPSLAG